MPESLVFSLLTGLSVVVFIGIFHASLRQLLVALFAPLRDATQATGAALADARERIRVAIQRLRASHQLEAPGHSLSVLVGFALFTGAFVILAVTEADLNGATLSGILGQASIGFLTRLSAVLGLNATAVSELLTVSILTQGVMWFAILADLYGFTHLISSERLRATHSANWVTYATLGLLVGVVIALAAFRLPILLGEDASAVPAATNVSVPSLSLAPALLPDGGEAIAPATAAPAAPATSAQNPYTDTQRFAVAFVTYALNVTTFLSVGVAGAIALPTGILLLQLGTMYILGALAALLHLMANLGTGIINYLFGIAFAIFALVARCANFLVTPLHHIPGLARRTDVDQPVVPSEPPGSPPDGPAGPGSGGSATEDGTTTPVMTPPPAGAPDRNWNPYGSGDSG